jgi:hypothetical protein
MWVGLRIWEAFPYPVFLVRCNWDEGFTGWVKNIVVSGVIFMGYVTFVFYLYALLLIIVWLAPLFLVWGC